jgi:hypothetical protein
MQGIIPLILIGLFAYFMFSRKGGMGCCGGHGGHDSDQNRKVKTGSSSHHEDMGNVIDLREDEYTILPAKHVEGFQSQRKY